VRVLFTIAVVVASCTLVSCAGNSPAPTQNTGVMTGNWQLNLMQSYPAPHTQLSVGGFLVQSSNSLTGSVQGPTIIGGNGTTPCGGVGPLTGTISGQNVTFSLNPGGTQFDFTGKVSSDSHSMSGSYQALGGACLGDPTSGTWTATIVPPLNGNFTGTLVSTQYMPALTGLSPTPGVPISVSGSFTQSSNSGGSNASITGTMTAVGYPCFTTAYLTGTINGQNVYLNVFDYSGVQIGTLGLPPVNGVGGTPATVVSGPTGVSLVMSTNGGVGMLLGSCPTIQGPFGPISSDSDSVTLNFPFQ
jgi:hypothetical protein